MKIGDTVYLKGDLSQSLSVYDIGLKGNIYCCWFDETYKLNRDVFHIDQLKNNDSDEPKNTAISLNA